jgi:hypothetical protein
MNRSYSKIRHIQESNERLEKRMLGEQFYGEMKKSVPSDNKFDFDTAIKDTKRKQLQDIIDNFDSINCDGIDEVSAESLYGERPERDIIYCTSYKGKSKQDLFNILNM